MAAPRTWRPADEPVTTPSVPNEASPAPLSRRRFSMRQLPLSSAPARYMYVESMAMAWPELLVERPVTTPFVPKPDTPAPLSRRRFSIRQSLVTVPPSYPARYMYVESITIG